VPERLQGLATVRPERIVAARLLALRLGIALARFARSGRSLARGERTWRALGLSIFLALAATACASRPLVENVEPGGRSLVLLLDASASMNENDPGRAAVQGATLALALAGQHDNVGVVAYNSRARILVPLRPSGLAPTREATQQEIEQVGTSGSTDFGVALDAAYAMLEAAKAPRGSAAILLTDGLPTGRISLRREFAGSADNALAVPDSVPRFAQRGWRIFAIVFGPEAAQTRGYLAQLVGPTGGSTIEATDASGLVPAFESVAVQALGYLKASKLQAGESVSVAPGTRRLAVLGRYDGQGELGAVARDDKPVEETALIRFPKAAPFSVALLEQPTPGRYKVETGNATGGLTLLEPGWDLVLDPKAPPPVIDGGTRVPVAVTIQGDEAELARLRDSVKLELEVKRAEKILARVPLAKGVNSLRFEGAFMAPPEAEPITATAIATVTAGDKSFEQRRSITVSVRSGTVAKVEPARLGVGSLPFLAGFDDEELRGSVELTGDAKTALVVNVEAPSGITATPAKVELAAGARATVELKVRGSGGSIGFAVTPATAGLQPFREERRLEVHRGSVPKEIDLGTVETTEKKALPVAARGVKLTPRAPLTLEGDATLVLDAHSLAAGTFEGTVEARCGSSIRTIPVKATITAPAPVATLPNKLMLKGSWGWTTTELDVGGKATLKFEPLVLDGTRAVIDPDLDIRVTEKEGGKYEVKFNVPSSLPPGRFTGAVTIEKEGEVKIIPISIEVSR
jgi:Mg-chelatase subunit ChlD